MTTQQVINKVAADNQLFDKGMKEAKRLLINGYAKVTLTETARVYLKNHAWDMYWQGILAYAENCG